jgi:hypothetical protein
MGERRKGHPPRLPGWNYSRPAACSVTFTVANRVPCLCRTEVASVVLSPWGSLVDRCWRGLPMQFPSVQLDEFIIMPDHVDAIIVLTSVSGEVIHDGSSHPDGASYPGVAMIDQGPTKGGPIKGSSSPRGGPNRGDPNQISPSRGGFQPMMADPRLLLGKEDRTSLAVAIQRANHPQQGRTRGDSPIHPRESGFLEAPEVSGSSAMIEDHGSR